MYAATATEKQEWMAHINKCIEELLRKSGKKAVKDHAAVWVPDSEASACMNCKKSQFTMLNRRHHCRKCGAVVCGPCSSKKFLLPNQSSKPLRVCTRCYETLAVAKKVQGGPQTLASNNDQQADRDSSGEDDSDDDDEQGNRVPQTHDMVSSRFESVCLGSFCGQ